jgi:hypothetical protein
MEIDLNPFEGDDSLHVNDLLDGIGNAIESIVDFVVPDGLFRFDLADYAPSGEDAHGTAHGHEVPAPSAVDGITPPELTGDGFYPAATLEGGGWEQQQLNQLIANVQTVEGMVDDVVADIEAHAPADPTGLFPYGMPGGSTTDSVLGFINGGGEVVTDLTRTVLSGDDLSADQLAAGRDLMDSNTGLNGLFNVMTWDAGISEDVDGQQQRIDHGNLWQETNGRLWHWNNNTGRWDRVYEDPTHGTPVYSPSPVDEPLVQPRFPGTEFPWATHE